MLLSTGEMAARCNVSVATVRNWILKRWVTATVVGARHVVEITDDELAELRALAGRFKVERKRIHPTRPQVMKLLQMRTAGEPWRKIARAVGLSVRTCRRIYVREH